MAKMTPSQKRALLWLFEKGGTTINAGRMTLALNSLSLCGGVSLVESYWGAFGKRGGTKLCWRLTLRGMHVAEEELKSKARFRRAEGGE